MSPSIDILIGILRPEDAGSLPVRGSIYGEFLDSSTWKCEIGKYSDKSVLSINYLPDLNKVMSNYRISPEYLPRGICRIL